MRYLNQIGDRDHQQLVPLGELAQLGHPRHRSVLVHDFADDAGRIEAGDPRQIDRRLGLTGADEDAAVARLRAGSCGRGAPDRRDESADRSRRARSPPDRWRRCRCWWPAWRRSITWNAVSNRVVFCVTISGISSSARRSSVIGHADQAAAVGGHEVDDLRGHLLRRDRQIAFVLPILVVHDDDHLAVADGLDGVNDRRRRTRPSSSLG